MCMCEQSEARLYLSTQILLKGGCKGMEIVKTFFYSGYIYACPKDYLKQQIFLRDPSKCNFCIPKHLLPFTNKWTQTGIPLILLPLWMNQFPCAFDLLDTLRGKHSNDKCCLMVILKYVKSPLNSYRSQILWTEGPLFPWINITKYRALSPRVAMLAQMYSLFLHAPLWQDHDIILDCTKFWTVRNKKRLRFFWPPPTKHWKTLLN